MAVSFMTRIPVFIPLRWNVKDYGKSMIYTPAVGFIIGLILFAVFHFTGQFFGDRLIPAAVTVLLWTLLTGGLHLDGVADSCDGLFSSRDREKILEIMKDSRIGTNGAVALFFILLFKFVLVYKIDPIFLIIAPAFGRMAMLLTAASLKYAGKPGGMGEAPVKYTTPFRFIIALCYTSAITFFIDKTALLIIVPILILTALINIFYYKKIRGVTGDTLGAVTEVCETVSLFFAVVLEIIISRLN